MFSVCSGKCVCVCVLHGVSKPNQCFDMLLHDTQISMIVSLCCFKSLNVLIVSFLGAEGLSG